MKTRDEIERELFALMTRDAGPAEEQIRHREGRIRSLAWVLCGRDVGYDCGRDLGGVLETLGWRYQRDGSAVTFWLPSESGGTRGYDE